MKKATRKVFSVKGKESAVRTVLNGLMGFKAVTVLSDMVTPDAMSEVFKNNKMLYVGLKTFRILLRMKML